MDNVTFLEGQTELVSRADVGAVVTEMRTAPDGKVIPIRSAPARKPPEPDPDPVKAPHGWRYTKGQWVAKKPAGRPPTRTRAPRVIDAKPKPETAAAAPKKPAGARPKKDYRNTISETLGAVYTVGAMIPVPEQILGKSADAVGTRLRVTMALIEQNSAGLVQGTQLISEHTDWLPKQLDKLQTGKGPLWVLPAAMAFLPFALSVVDVWSKPVTDDLRAVAAGVEASVKAAMSAQVDAAIAALALAEQGAEA